MGWADIGGDNRMTSSQERAIRTLRAAIDGRPLGEYEQQELPAYTRLQAGKEIEKLQNKLLKRRRKHACMDDRH
jgi:hypothetical protein